MGRAYYGLWNGDNWVTDASGRIFAFDDPAPLFCQIARLRDVEGYTWRVAVMPEWGGKPVHFIHPPLEGAGRG